MPTTYYVSPTGNDASVTPTNINTPWQTLQRGTQAPVAPGDTILALDGTYTNNNSNDTLVWVSTSRNSVAGTQAQPITMKSLNKWGAKVIIPSTNATGGAAFSPARDWWIFDGFDISGGTLPGTGNISYAAYSLFAATNGVILRNNRIHDVARTVCSDSVFGFSGILVGQPTNVVSNCIIEDNIIFTVGRLRQGESACTTIRYQGDHGIYIDTSTNLTIRRNLIYDCTRGYALHVFPGAHTNLNIFNNTLVDNSPTGLPIGHMILAQSVINGLKFQNNLSYNSTVCMVSYGSSVPTCTNVLIDHNIYYNAQDSGTRPAGVTFSNNILSTNPGFTNASLRDYTLVPGAFAIDKGIDVGLPFSGAAPDIGYNEFVTSGDTTPPATPTGLQVI